MSRMRHIKSVETWKIYALQHPRTQVVRYIGCTCRTINSRLAWHRGMLASAPMQQWRKTLRSKEPTVIVLETFRGSHSAATEREKWWIARFLKCSLLLNLHRRPAVQNALDAP